MDWDERRVLVTGATGFIGQRLVRRLVEAGARVCAGVSPAEHPERVAALTTQAQKLLFDLRDAEAVRTVTAEAAPHIVIHLAAVGATNPGVDPALALAVNAGGALHLLDALKERASKGNHVQRVVLVGTCYEYGGRGASEGLDPFNAYAASKVAAWAFGRAYWRAYGLPVVTARPFQVYGPGQAGHTLIPAAISAALAGKDFAMTLGEQERDFVYVDDVIKGMLAAAVAPDIEGRSLDLGTGRVHPMHDVIERVWTMTDAQGCILAGALPYRPGEVMHLVADADRAARLTGWRARVGLEEGLECTIDWMREARDD